jgi:hypothetical protein
MTQRGISGRIFLFIFAFLVFCFSHVFLGQAVNGTLLGTVTGR